MEELLTDDEHALVERLGKCYTDFVALCGHDIPSDKAEFAAQIHNLQYMVLANAAARAYPDRYRRRGFYGDWNNSTVL